MHKTIHKELMMDLIKNSPDTLNYWLKVSKG